MMRDTPRIVFLDIQGREIFPPVYQEPNLQGIAKQDQNGQLQTRSKLYDYAAALNAVGEEESLF